jgi:hypothetical protein
MKTNYRDTAHEMRNALATLPGWTASEITESADGYSFIVTREPKADRKGNRTPGFTEKRTIGHDGTLTITKL